MKRRDFICGASCLIVGFAISEFKNREIKSNNNPKADEYNSVNSDIDEIFLEVTSHCNLNCKGCDAFSPLSKTEFIEYEQFEKDIRKIKILYPDKNIKFLFIGGEPLLNPDITKMIILITDLFPDCQKKMLTNGILLKDMDDDFWKAAKKADIEIQVTNHPIDIDRTIGENKAKKYGINYKNDIVYTDKLYDLNTREVSKENIQPIKGHYWSKPIIDIKGNQDYIEKRYNCVHKDYGHNLGISYARGNLYFCWVHAHINAFSEYFKLNIPITKDDYIKIADIKDIKEIQDFISSPKPLCRFCKQCHNTCFHGKPVEWGFSKREISEWT